MRSILLPALILCISFSYGQNVGIGETSPANKLAVKGSLSIGSGYSQTAAPADGAIIQGNVGIGTTSSSTTLTVATGSGHWQTAMTILPTTYVGSSRAALAIDDWLILQDQYGGGTKDFAIYQTSAGQQRFVILTNGNTGIGTLSPGTLLDVNGALTLRETQVPVVSNAATIPSNVSQVQLTGSATATITLTAPPAPANAGERLVIYNNTTGGFAASYGTATIPNGVAMEFIYSNSIWVATTPASSGSGSYIQNQNAAAQSSSVFWISGDGRSTTSFTTPLLQSPSATNLGVTAGSDLVMSTNGGTESMRLFTNGSARIKNVSTLATPNPGLEIDMTNGTQVGAEGLLIDKFPSSGSNARTGLAVDMTNAKSSTGVAVSNIGSSAMIGMTIDADANGNGTGIKMGSNFTLGTGINIKGGTGILYNALNSGSGTGLSIGGTTAPSTGVNAQASGSGGYGGIFQSTSAGAGLFGLSITGAYSTPAQIPLAGTRGYAASNGSGDVTYGIYGSSEQGTGAAGNTANTGYGVYGLATANGSSNNGFAIGMYGTATTAGNGNRGAIGGFFATANNSHSLSLAATGGDVYLGSSDANRPANFNGSVTAGMTVGIGNTNNVYMYNSLISGTTTYYGSSSGTVGITAPPTVTANYNISLPTAAPASTLPLYMTSTGALTTTGATTGIQGYWNRTGTSLAPTTAGDAITTSGNISTTGSGTLSVAGAATLSSTVTVPTLNTAGIVTNTAAGLLGTIASVPVTNGGTGTPTAFTPGSVVFAGTSGVYAQNNAKFFWDNTNNRLGIGTAAPQFSLHVYNPSAATSMVIGGNTSSGGYTALLLATSANTGGYSGLQSIGVAGTSYGILALNASGGNVGVGTSGALNTLDVNGGLLVRGTSTLTPATPISAVEFAVGRQQNGTMQSGQTTADIALEYASGGYRHYIMSRHLSSSGSSNQNAIDFYLNNSTTTGGSSAPGTGNVNAMSITAAGVGVNTNAPTQILDVKGVNTAPATSGTTSTAIIRMENTTANGNVLDMGNYNTSPYGTWIQATDRTSLAATYPIAINPIGGNVGVGTSSPAGLLHIVTPSNNGNTAAWSNGNVVIGQSGTTGGALGLSYSTTDNGGTAYLSALAPAVAWEYMGYRASNHIFYVNGATEAMRIASTGNVMIGTTTATNNRLLSYEPATTAVGSNYTYNASYSGVGGYNPASLRSTNASAYQYGVEGEKDINYDGAYYLDERSAGVMGSLYYSGSSLYTTGVITWGALGYESSGGWTSWYGSYAASATTGTGYAPSHEETGIGSGAYGGVIGGWTRGNVMGHVSCGELFASYNLGNAYTSGHNIEIVQNGDRRVAAYSNTSTEATVNKAGKGQLTGGRASVSFDANFAAMLSKEEDPIVTITPIGNCNGIHIISISKDGFEVEENNNGTANVAFTYIVMGKRFDAETATLPADLADKNFDSNMKKVMFNENDKEHSASPVWWDGNKIRFDAKPKGGAKK